MRAVADAELQRLLDEDIPFGDLTTELIGRGAIAGKMSFFARDPMVLAVIEDAEAMIRLAGGAVITHAQSGDKLLSGAPILTANGPASALFRCWKVAQTLIEVWSGIASATRTIVEVAKSAAPNVSVACTRKNVPGTKRFAASAIKAGGAVMHRLGLSETVLVFPEHLIFLDEEPLTDLASRLARAAPEKKLIIEVSSREEALAAVSAGFDVIQAEKFVPGEIAALRRAVAYASPRVIIAAAGGINPDNAAAYAAAGADVLVTSWSYLARPCDVQVRFSTTSC